VGVSGQVEVEGVVVQLEDVGSVVVVEEEVVVVVIEDDVKVHVEVISVVVVLGDDVEVHVEDVAVLFVPGNDIVDQADLLDNVDHVFVVRLEGHSRSPPSSSPQHSPNSGSHPLPRFYQHKPPRLQHLSDGHLPQCNSDFPQYP
jgi:hypothetical protein